MGPLLAPALETSLLLQPASELGSSGYGSLFLSMFRCCWVLRELAVSSS